MLQRRALIFLALAWILVMLYPDPGVLVRSIRNLVRPQIQPQAVAALARRLPNDPRKIEAHILDDQVPYAYDWESAGVPWYFPTTAEVLRAGRGDCESRAVVLASILTAKGIPNALRLSFDHIWVEYPGKQPNALENAGVQFAGTQNGHFFIHWPEDFHLGQEISAQLAIYWRPAPLSRVVLLFVGLALVVSWNGIAWLLGAGRLGADNLLTADSAAAGRRRRGPRRASRAHLATSGSIARQRM